MSPEVSAAPSSEEILVVARGIATAVAPSSGLTDAQADLLQAITLALTGELVDYTALEPCDAETLAAALVGRDGSYRHRIVHHMVLGELILVPLPEDVASRVAHYASVLGVEDDFIDIAREYARGALGLAWVDLRRSGFTDRWSDDRMAPLHSSTTMDDPFDTPSLDAALAERWKRFARSSPTAPSDARCGACTRCADGIRPVRRWVPRRSSRSTTSCTCSPTTARTSRESSRSSR